MHACIMKQRDEEVTGDDAIICIVSKHIGHFIGMHACAHIQNDGSISTMLYLYVGMDSYHPPQSRSTDTDILIGGILTMYLSLAHYSNKSFKIKK